jgi:hypothetical protein
MNLQNIENLLKYNTKTPHMFVIYFENCSDCKNYFTGTNVFNILSSYFKKTQTFNPQKLSSIVRP